jgi:ankyrin repeat protein
MKKSRMLTVLGLILAFGSHLGIAQDSKKCADDDLCKAIGRGDASDVASLLQKGADVDARFDYEGSFSQAPVLVVAVAYGKPDMLSLLLEHGAKIDAADANGRTALFNAVDRRDAGMIRLLIDKGAQVDAADSHGWTPLTHAAYKATEADVEVVKLLLQNRAKADQALINSIMSEPSPFATEVVKTILDHGVNLETHDDANGGMTPLHHAAFARNPEVVSLLLEKGAFIEARDNYGDTPLVMAIASSLQGTTRAEGLDVVRILVDHGASVTAKDNVGKTPLDYVDRLPQALPILQAALTRPTSRAARSDSAVQASVRKVSGSALSNGVLASGSVGFRGLSEMKERDSERTRIQGVLARFGARNVKWVEAEKLSFTDLETGSIPALMDDLKYKADSNATGGRVLMHELVEFGCQVEATYRTAEIRGGIETTLTLQVTQGAKLFYVPAQGQREQQVTVNSDGSASFRIRLARGQDAVYARTELGAVKRYIRVDVYSGEQSDVSEDEYRAKTK